MPIIRTTILEKGKSLERNWVCSNFFCTVSRNKWYLEMIDSKKIFSYNGFIKRIGKQWEWVSAVSICRKEWTEECHYVF